VFYKPLKSNKFFGNNMVNIKGHKIEAIVIKDSFDRRALQFKNEIIEVLRTIDVKKDDIEIPLERMAIKKAKASVTWYYDNQRMHYSYNMQGKFVENMYIVFKLLEIEVNLIISKKKTINEFMEEFREDSDVEEKRTEARGFLGLKENEDNLEVIDKKYKEMAKELHPDTQNGDTEKFKELNNAHKILRRELM